MSSIWVKLGLDSQGFERGLEKARGSVKQFGGIAEKGLNLGRVLGIGAAVAAMDRVLAQMQELDDAARRLDVGVGFVQELQELAGQVAGVDLDNLVEFLQDVNEKAMDAARGSGEAAEAFAMLGLSAESFVGMGLEQQFRKIADAVANAEDKQGAIAAVMKIGSDEATKLLPLLREGSDGIDRMTEGMAKFADGTVEAMAAARREAQTTMRELGKGTVNGLSNVVLGVKGAARAIGAIWEQMGDASAVSNADIARAFLSPWQEAQDAAYDEETRRQEESAARAEYVQRQRGLAVQKELEKERAAREQAAKDYQSEVDRRMATGRESARELLDQQRRAEERAVEDRKRAVEEEIRREREGGLYGALKAGEGGLMEQLGRISGAAGGPQIDSLTAIGLGASGVNYALQQPRGEVLQRQMLKELEMIRGEIEGFDRELELRVDEFGS